MTEDFVIAVRSYNRAELFGKLTLKTLMEHGLTPYMTVFVGSDIAPYRERYPHLTFIPVPAGGHNATKAICEYYPLGTKILFLDDDIYGYFEIDISGNKIPGDLKAAIQLGFSLGDIPFQFSAITNRHWMKARPAISKRYAGLVGYAFGTRNHPELVITPLGGHTDETYRTVQYLKNGIVPNVLNHCALWTKGWGITPGGYQSNGRKLDETKAETAAVAELCAGWVGKPFLNEKAQFWQILVLPPATLKRLVQSI